MTDEEIKKRMEELAYLKIQPRDYEENRLVLLRAEHPPQEQIVSGETAFPLKHPDANRGLVVPYGVKTLGMTGGNDRVSLNDGAEPAVLILENRLVLLRAERMYEEALGDRRKKLDHYITAFEAALKRGRHDEIMAARETLTQKIRHQRLHSGHVEKYSRRSVGDKGNRPHIHMSTVNIKLFPGLSKLLRCKLSHFTLQPFRQKQSVPGGVGDRGAKGAKGPGIGGRDLYL